MDLALGRFFASFVEFRRPEFEGAMRVGCINSVSAWWARARPHSRAPVPLIPEELSLFWSLCYLAFRCLLRLVLLRPRSCEFKELEIVVLRHQLAVLRRQKVARN